MEKQHSEMVESVDPTMSIDHTHQPTLRPGEDAEVAFEAIGGASSDDLPPGYYRSWPFLGTLLAVFLGENALYCAASMPFNVLTIINEDLGPDPSYVWIAVVFSVTQAFTFVLLGRLGDLLGRRWMFIGITLLGLLGGILAAVAKSIPTLIVGSAFLGICAAAQQSFPMILSELVPNKYRGITTGAIVLSALPVVCFGPVFIRLMVLHTAGSWRWTYRLNVILSGLSAICFYSAYNPPTYSMLHARRDKKIAPWKMIDIVGTLIFLAGLTMLLLGLSWGGSLYSWRSGHVIGFIVAGVVLLIAFVPWELYGAREFPLLPMKLFSNRGYVAILLTGGIATMSFFALLVLWPVQLSLMYDHTVMGVAWKSCVLQSGTYIGTGLSALLVKPLGKQKYQLVGAVALLTAFTAGMAGTTPSTEAMALAFVCIIGTCIGWIENVAITIAPFCLKHEDLGLAIGLLGTSRATLAAIAQVVYVSIFENKIVTEIPKYVIPAAVDAGLPESSLPALLTGLGTGNLTAVPGLTAAITGAAVYAEELAYSESFKYVYLASIAFGGIGLIAALNAPNTEKDFTSAISRKLHGTGLETTVPSFVEDEKSHEART